MAQTIYLQCRRPRFDPWVGKIPWRREWLLTHDLQIFSLSLWLVFSSSLLLFSVTQSCPTLCDPMDCSTPGFPVLHSLPELAQTHIHRVSDAIQTSHPLSSPPPAFNLSQHQGLLQCVGSSHQVAKVFGALLQQQSFQWIFRTDFLRMDWFDLLVVQGTLRSLQYHSSKSSIWLSVFFIVQLSHTYVTTGKTIALHNKGKKWYGPNRSRTY